MRPPRRDVADAESRVRSCTGRTNSVNITPSRWLVCAGAGLTLVLASAGVAPAVAAPAADDDVLGAVTAAAPESIRAVANVTTTSTGEAAIDATLEGVDVTVPTDPADGVTVDDVSIDLPFAARADDAIVERPGVVSYDNNNGSTTVPVVRADGSVQINTVIENAGAPRRYEYALDIPAGASMQEASGSILIVGVDGELVGGVAPAWATDANGTAVPTRYEVDGTTITQVVEHDATHTYPVVADPWLGSNLFGTMSKSTFKTKPKYTGVLSGWGSAVYSGIAQGGGIAGAAAGQAILRDAGWSEWKSRLVGSNPAATLKQQYDCHVLGGYAVWLSGVHWDLEAVRSSNPNWLNNVNGHRCNWG